MDPIVASAATALVGAMVTDAWQDVHTALVSWWRRICPQQADSVDAELQQSRDRAVAARRERDTDAESELVAAWEDRLAELLGENRELADELRRLMERDIAPQVHREHVHQDTGNRAGTQEVHAEASGNARVFIAGRDQHIHEP
ncbi:hypothetical protein [Streptomyces sp. NPDC058683]|uniref:hypothetical protein n=1 Tax=Streptomyces sp. NPDC058683 TaxID=3346597 RepID=UPI00364EDDE2